MSTSDNTNQTVSESEQAATSSRPQSQRVMLLFVLAGLSFAGWHGWMQQDLLLRMLGYRVSKPLVTPASVGFDVSNSVVPVKEIHAGAKQDGIPSLTNPKFISLADANAHKVKFLKPESKVVGIFFENEARAYPLSILDSHEAINDRIGETSFAVVYCPLCDSSVVYNRKTNQGEIEFGISGFLYNSNVLLYDRSSKQNKENSLWSQMMSQSISGPKAKQQLATLPFEITTWEDWSNRYPQTKVLSHKTDYPIAYHHSRPAYQNYLLDDRLMFSVNKEDKRLPNKTALLGVWIDNQMRAYPITAFESVTEPLELKQELAGKSFTIVYNPKAKSLRIKQQKNVDLQWMYSYWFAWYAFHPQTELFDATMLQTTP